MRVARGASSRENCEGGTSSSVRSKYRDVVCMMEADPQKADLLTSTRVERVNHIGQLWTDVRIRDGRVPLSWRIELLVHHIQVVLFDAIQCHVTGWNPQQRH
jgi:hypothetical protein